MFYVYQPTVTNNKIVDFQQSEFFNRGWTVDWLAGIIWRNDGYASHRCMAMCAEYIMFCPYAKHINIFAVISLKLNSWMGWLWLFHYDILSTIAYWICFSSVVVAFYLFYFFIEIQCGTYSTNTLHIDWPVGSTSFSFKFCLLLHAGT